MKALRNIALVLSVMLAGCSEWNTLSPATEGQQIKTLSEVKSNIYLYSFFLFGALTSTMLTVLVGLSAPRDKDKSYAPKTN